MRIWFAFLGPPAFWTLHLLVGYGYEEAACSTRGGVGLVEPVVVTATVVLGALTALAGLTGLRLLREAGRREPDPRGSVSLMASVGALWSPLFLFAIVLGGVQLVVLDPCVSA